MNSRKSWPPNLARFQEETPNSMKNYDLVLFYIILESYMLSDSHMVCVWHWHIVVSSKALVEHIMVCRQEKLEIASLVQ